MECRLSLALWAFLLLGTTNAQNSGCTGYADVVFVVDSSDAVGKNDYQKELELVKQTVNKMNIGQRGVNVGLVTYGSQSQAVFNLKDHTSASAINNAIGGAPFIGGAEGILDGLTTAKNQMFTPTAGVRDKTSRIVVLVSAGRSNNPSLTKLRGEELRSNDIDVYAVGIGAGVDKNELNGIANDPDNRYVYTADNFDSAQALANALSSKICNEIPDDPQFLPPPTSCLQKADIMFLLDSSSSIGQTNFQKLEDFLKNTIKDLDVGPDKVRVGLMQYSGYPSLEFPLNMYSNRYDALKAVDKVSYMGGGANTADALKYMRQLGFSQSNGARADVPRIAVVLTDGSSPNSAGVATEANNARRDNIGLISVGVGPNVNTGELQAIANDPDNTHMFNPQDYSQLASLSKQIIDAACTVQTTSPSMTTAQPGGTLPPDPCKDNIPNCAAYGSICDSFKTWAKANCEKYCGICQPLYTTAPPTCDDVRSDCSSYSASSCTGPYRPYMEQNCPRFCGFCGIDTQTLGFYGKCAYKGHAYSTGEKWEDGCDYECVCENGDTGKYRCYNKCPVYYNLPSECTLVKDPSSCCLKPQCNFDQTVSTTQNVNKGNKNGIDTCVYNGKNYYQDQQWQDGCSAQCVCVDASTGRHECHDLCPTYTRLPSYCRLEKTPGACCPTPTCEFQNQVGTFTGLGSISSHGIGSSPASLPPCVNTLNNCPLYGKPACTQYRQWALTNCRDFCGLCSTGPDPGPDDKCLYQGNQYSQGQSWFVGSSTQCTCENAVSGYYRCVDMCPTYTNLPPTCTTTTSPGSSCPVISCPSGTFISSSNNLGSLGNGGNIQKGPATNYLPPTLPSGAKAPVGSGGPEDQAPKLEGCLYNGQLYVQGQRWNDGCSASCECLDATTGRTKCRERCPIYSNVPQGCTMTSDPDDPCCVKPQCADPSVIPVPAFKPYTTNNKPVAPPSEKERFTGTGGLLGPMSEKVTIVQTGPTTTPMTIGPYSTGGIGHCDYKGKQYLQSETWEDGCDYNCVCDDASFGHYTCTEKCVKYQSIPFPYCQLIQDPTNQCCKIPSCVWTAPREMITNYQLVNPTTPGLKSTTVAPTPGFAFCVYKGKSYDQNQVWYDGCDFRCTCEEPATNKFRCEDRCPSFPASPNCKLVPDTKDPSCCTVLECPTPSPAPGVTPDPTPTSVPGVIVGGTNPPGTATGTIKGFCEYSGQKYRQGETWDNGCEYNCVCEDEVTGRYKCTEKCNRYDNLAPNCYLVDDFANPCCQIPRCDPVPEYTTKIPGPNQGTTIRPEDKSYCVYNNVKYESGQQWVDGCDKKCQCDNADTGVYSCTERCITYEDLPPECKLVTDPRDTCCLVPQCGTPAPMETPAPPQIGGSTLVPGQQGPNPTPGATEAPTPTAVLGKITGVPVVPSPTPGPDGKTVAPPQLTYCEYKGTRYNQDQKWNDGCIFTCECVNALIGKYECTERCPRYVNLPAECRLVKDPSNPCCEVPDCQPNPNGPGTTLAPGVTRVPTTAGGPTPAPKNACVYKGAQYTQGQKWFDGCDYTCECENSMQGLYRCDNRCPSYDQAVPQGCYLKPDPSDPFCCKEIACDIPISVNNKTGTGLIPTPPPAIKTGGVATPAPTPIDPNSPPPLPGQPTPSPVPQGVCIYNGRQYKQGSRWQDGCDYNCECLDGSGRYKCTEICPRLPQLPSACVLIPDVNNPCCKTTYCNFTQVTVTPAPKTTTMQPNPFFTPTPSPRTNVCLYNGVAFMQGQTWNDGCELQCVCENATTGFYRCNQRCAQYPDALNPDCVQMTDPRDSCCKVPICPNTPAPNPNPIPTGAPDPNHPGSTLPPPTWGPNPTLSPTGAPDPNDPSKTLAPPTARPYATPGPNPNPNPNPYTFPTPKPGTIDGYLVPPSQGPVPDPNNPGATLPPSKVTGCLYGGQLYKTGQKWQDGCQYICVCQDDTTGKYTCTERCPLYPNLPTNCRLINDPQDLCCKVPDCQPTPSPTPSMTPPVGMTTVSPNPNGVPTPAPPQKANVCVYKGATYTQGQKWNDGCDKVCVCDNAMTGLYRCSTRCPTFQNLQPGCTLIPDPNDPTCCEVPQCIPVPNPNDPVTPGPTQVYTNLPTGSVTGQAPVPLPTTSQPGQSTPPPTQGCMYKNQMYVQGQRWQDGCQYDCVCEDGVTGKYKCVQRCPVPPKLPAQCKLVTDPNDFCCLVPSCDYSQTPTPGQPPQITLTPTPKGYTPPPGVTPAPTPASFCVYNGAPYRQGQTWNDGCNFICRCEKADQNSYSCFDRCPTYKLQPGCTLVTDPKDSCCQVPQCVPTSAPTLAPTPFPNGTYPNPTPQPTQGPNNPNTISPQPQLTPAPYPIPNPKGTIVGTPPPQQKTGFCEYKGQQYQTGAKWMDGCDYNCQCLDQMSGIYSCTQRCSPYPSIPPTCVMVSDPNDQCCQKPYCPNMTPPPQGPTPTPGPTVPGASKPSTSSPATPPINPLPTLFTPLAPTASPPPGSVPNPLPQDVCVYMGRSYTEGQKWQVGCDKTCICDDGKTGAYTCTERCPNYNMMPSAGKRQVPTNCVLVPDPRDPLCCKVPDCSSQGPNPTLTGVTGVVTGSHTLPPTNPTAVPPTGPTPPTPPPACVYKGSRYSKGQRWQDGCDYECVCLDDMSGNFKCTDKCPVYPNLPVSCTMVYDPQNPCCKKVECLTPGPGGAVPTPGGTPSPDVCVYNGVPYRQGQRWQVGCDKVCVCEDASTRRITCDDRCPTFQAVPAGCQLATDPQDSCCQTLNCPVPPPGLPITPLPASVVTGANVPAANPTPYTGGISDVCFYRGNTYRQGQKWQDGCTYTCVCTDGVTGKYMCTDRCPTYPPLPASCTMVQDPQDACCKKPYCPPTPAPPQGVTPSVAPTVPGAPAPSPTPLPRPPDTCVYNGRTYKQGQQWFDGCSKVCKCEDSSMNFYRCEDRCTLYPQVPAGCRMVPDPQDPKCCEKPECPVQVGPNPTSGFVQTPSYPTPGSITGIGKIPTNGPTPLPGMTTKTPLPSTGCYYGNTVYKQGDKWQVGCSQECVCTDGMTGLYSCTELCPPLPSNLPPTCRTLQDPNQPCCGRVYCDTVNPTPKFPTPAPNPPGSTTNPSYYTPGPTNSFSGNNGFCVYQGVYYKQGQTWEDGCTKRCKCEDTSTGYYTCRERCPSFTNLPPSCTLITDPKDACCVVPSCNQYPTSLPNGQTPAPGPTPPLIFTPTPAPPGSVVGTGTGIGGQSGMCVHSGQTYGQGQTWMDGCTFKCECIDAQRGQFRCTDRCQKYYELPRECYKIPDPKDACCEQVECNFSPDATRPTAGPTPSVTPSVLVPVTDECVYNNKKYTQGSVWNDGCTGVCKCVDAATNNYMCTQRCPVFSSLPKECTLTPDPNDACCMEPTCTGTLTPIIGGNGPTSRPPDNRTDVFPVGTHTTITGAELPPQGSTGPVIHGKRVGCVYKGNQYRQGAAWNDGCDFVCSCIDEINGIYKCTSKCPTLPQLPNYCSKLVIPGQCCESVRCDLPGKGQYSPIPELTPDLIPTPGPVSQPGQTTPMTWVVGPNPGTQTGTSYPGTGATVPPNVNIGQLRDKCISQDNRMYNQGESWLQGCDFNCTCLDGRSGYYKCAPLCPTYDSLPSSCYSEKSGCCMRPKCVDENGNVVDPDKNPTAYPVVGSVVGGFTGFRPGYLQNLTGSTGPGCIYKNQFYREGQQWEDGCDFSCTCEDGQMRRFVCTPKCKQYLYIPPGYKLMPDPQGCCEILVKPQTVDPVTTTRNPLPDNCKDARPDCDSFGSVGKDGCVGQYVDWARANCARTCGYCDPSGTSSPNITPTPNPGTDDCVDAIANCMDYGPDACKGQYEPWAKQNCKKTCGFCKGCFDKLDNCGSIGNFYCSGPYLDWAKENCNATCNLCSVTIIPVVHPWISGNDTGTPIGGTNSTFSRYSQIGWMTLLKGVSGAPGDLLGLWQSKNTINEKNPNAMELSNRLKENYKPAISNYWDECKFQYVKLSVMTQGNEDAYILFDARGTDKMNWFDPKRIINSTFTDIQGANFDTFSAIGDTNTGRHFVVTQNTQSCNVKGWIMISTQKNCFFENSGTTEFHYSATNSVGQFGIDSKKADIFVLSAYGAQCNVSKTDEVACVYKGQNYNTGDTWVDGCEKNCTCVDASLGYTQCESLCPTISNLPLGCQLVKKADQCCSEVVCNPGARGCFYNNHFYNQDETWEDGCDYNCKCVDAQNGYYQCSAKCLIYKNLPSECRELAPPPGKCCSVVSCPPGIVVNLPDDYVPQ